MKKRIGELFAHLTIREMRRLRELRDYLTPTDGYVIAAIRATLDGEWSGASLRKLAEYGPLSSSEAGRSMKNLVAHGVIEELETHRGKKTMRRLQPVDLWSVPAEGHAKKQSVPRPGRSRKKVSPRRDKSVPVRSTKSRRDMRSLHREVCKQTGLPASLREREGRDPLERSIEHLRDVRTTHALGWLPDKELTRGFVISLARRRRDLDIEEALASYWAFTMDTPLKADTPDGQFNAVEAWIRTRWSDAERDARMKEFVAKRDAKEQAAGAKR